MMDDVDQSVHARLLQALQSEEADHPQAAVSDESLQLPYGVRWLSPEADLHPLKIHIFVGGTNTGKTYMAIDLLKRFRSYFSYGIAVSPTLQTRDQLSEVMPSTLVHSDISKEMLRQILDYQDSMSQIYGEDHMPKCFLFLDDCAHRRDLINSPLFEELVNNGRHYGIALFLTAQYIMRVPPALRTQAHHAFMFRVDSAQTVEQYGQMIFGCVPKQGFVGTNKEPGLFGMSTGNRRALVRVYNPDSNDISKNVFVHKVFPDASEESAQLCSPFMHWLHDLFWLDTTADTKAREINNALSLKRAALLFAGPAVANAFQGAPQGFGQMLTSIRARAHV